MLRHGGGRQAVTNPALCASRRESSFKISAPEGRSILAQRFSAGDSGTDDPSPGGTTEFRNSSVAAALGRVLGSAHRTLFWIRRDGSLTKLSGSSSAVERQLPKLDVTGSIPVSRSIQPSTQIALEAFRKSKRSEE